MYEKIPERRSGRSEHVANQGLAEGAGPKQVRDIMRQHQQLFDSGALRKKATRLLLTNEYNTLTKVGLSEVDINQKLERLIEKLAPA